MKTRLAAALIILASSLSHADELSTELTLHERWVQMYREIAENIAMRRGESPLTLNPAPLLVYTNPVRKTSQHGAIFLWTDGGRPAVFGSIWSAIDRTNPGLRNVTHEWHSLAERPLRAARGQELLWECDEPGIAWQQFHWPIPVDDARPGRLIQMRVLVRQLSAEIEAEGESELRLMSQPLYRYPETVEAALDGAIFAFAMGTDPEVLVLIEASEQQGQPSWRCAFARFGAQPMKVASDDRTMVWSCDEARPAERNGKYHLHYRAAQLPATLDSTP